MNCPSPGPADKAGICMDVIHQASGHIPILGVCLGHQAIGAAFGGQINRIDPLYMVSCLM